jgi:hypothetical protein
MVMQWAASVSRSTTTQRESYPDWVLGNHMTKSVAISSSLPLRYSQRLQHPNGSLMLGLDTLTGVAKRQHTQQYLSSFRTTNRLPWDHDTSYSLLGEWNRRSCVPHEVFIFQFFDVRHTNPSFVPQYSLFTFRKSRWLLFLGIALYLLNIFAFHLMFPNILE